MKICFYARAGQLKFYTKIAKKILESHVEICFITQTSEETKYVIENIQEAKVYEIYSYLDENWDKYDINNYKDRLSILKEKYIENNIWEMFYTDRFLINYNFEDSVKFILLHFDFYEHIFQSEAPNFFLNEAVAIFSSYVAVVVAEKNQCFYLGTVIARDDSQNKFFFFNDVYQSNLEMQKLFFENKFTDEQLLEASEYLYEFREKQQIPAYMNAHKKSPQFKLKYLLYPFKYLYTGLNKDYNIKTHYMEYGQKFNDSFSPLTMYIRHLFSKKYYNSCDKQDKYYLYTLHFQPEASTLVCAKKYEKQLFAIDNIAKSIPIDTVLYVKEHYAALGHRNIHFYKQLQKYPNVKLIDPFESIHNLIINSEAVIVLTNTTGFESIMYNKKVFILGKVFYDFFDNVEKIEDVFTEKYKLLDTKTTTTDEEIIRFIASYKQSLSEGCMYATFEKYLSDDNIKKVAIAILKEVKKDKYIK